MRRKRDYSVRGGLRLALTPLARHACVNNRAQRAWNCTRLATALRTGLSQILRHAHARLGGGDVLAERRDVDEAAGLVELDGLGLARAGFQNDAGQAQLAGVDLELGEDRAPDAAPACIGPDVHPLDLA